LLVNQTILWLVGTLFLAIALILLMPMAVLFAECAAALLPNRQRMPASTYRPTIAVLVPAHNEALGIGKTLETLRPQLTASDRLIVIADNCTDETAEISRSYGATVIERQDADRKGKGYALDYGLRFLEASPSEVVAIVDADCIVDPGAIEQIAALTFATSRPTQALYLMAQPAQPKPKDSVSALAFLVKNLVRPAGLMQLNLPCLLTGTGMAFPWEVMRDMSLASSNIVEDMQLSVDLAIAGYAPRFCPEARVTGQLPQQEQAAKSQRTRWEHGHLQTLISQVPRLLKAAIVQQRFDLLAIALDLCVPPLSLLLMLWAAALILSVAVALLDISFWLPTILLAAEGMLILVSIVSAWVKFGRESIPGKTLLAVPLYMLWKIPLYFAFLVRPQTQWVRTEREQADTFKP
jgi:cellulose synthase/poly-beta-1,6-N-acetylglucosamine synthase-like glycosyltransferase